MKNVKHDDILNKKLIYKIEFITQQYIFIDGKRNCYVPDYKHYYKI